VICDFIYTKEGLRIPSGDAVITITGPDGVTRTLVVVRSGKGRSRLDRWSDKPRPDGVVGEINTRDLQEWMELSNSREIPGKITVDGVELDVILDSEAMMGRAGRQSEGFREYLAGLDPESQRAAALLMIKGSPYGTEHTEDFRDGVDAALETLSEDDVRALIESGEMNFLAHLDGDKFDVTTNLFSQEIKASTKKPAWLLERLESSARVALACDLVSSGDMKTRSYVKNNGFSIQEMIRVVDRGSMSVAKLVVTTSPEETMRVIRDERASLLTRVILAGEIGASYLSSSDAEALLRPEIINILREDKTFFKDNMGRPDGDASDKGRLRVYTELFNAAGLSCSTKIRQLALQEDSLNGFDDVSVTPPAALAALGWAGSFKNSPEVSPENARDLAEILLRQGLSSGYVRPVNTRANPSNGVSSTIEDLKFTKKLETSRHVAETSEYLIKMLGMLDPKDAIDIIENQMRSSSEHLYLSHRAETLLVAAHPAAKSALDTLLESKATPLVLHLENIGVASYRNRPALGLLKAMEGSSEADLWLRELSDVVRAIPHNGGTGVYYLDEMSSNAAEPSFVAAVAASVSSRNNADADRELLHRTKRAAIAFNPFVLRRIMSPDDSSTSGHWMDTANLSSLWPHLDKREESAMQVAVRLRAGVAMGTSDVSILIEMMNNEREMQAGPIAALRIIGHPDVKPLSETPDQHHIDIATQLLSDYSEYFRRSTVGEIIAESKVILKTAGFWGAKVKFGVTS
jgi:hypothetical protein